MLNRARGPARTPRLTQPAWSSTVVRRGAGSDAPLARPGQEVFSNEVWRQLARSLALSKRKIVPALFDDKKESAIATQLGISRHTVHTYTERLYFGLLCAAI
jgi:FixJ family two-component response regulator